MVAIGQEEYDWLVLAKKEVYDWLVLPKRNMIGWYCYERQPSALPTRSPPMQSISLMESQNRSQITRRKTLNCYWLDNKVIILRLMDTC